MVVQDVILNRIFTLTIASVIFTQVTSCNNTSNQNLLPQTDSLKNSNIVINPEQNNLEFDTTFVVFNDPNYFVSIQLFKSKNIDQETYLGTLTLNHNINNHVTIIFRDTLEVFRPILKFQDFNNDKLKDILILYESSARSNWTHHLYLVDNINHNLTHVIGFEEVCNPEFDSDNNIIKSYTLSGTNYYSFYRINKKNKLINLGNSFDCDGTEKDQLKYKKAIKNIKSKLQH